MAVKVLLYYYLINSLVASVHLLIQDHILPTNKQFLFLVDKSVAPFPLLQLHYYVP